LPKQPDRRWFNPPKCAQARIKKRPALAKSLIQEVVEKEIVPYEAQR